jgi:hypothetical protein
MVALKSPAEKEKRAMDAAERSMVEAVRAVWAERTGNPGLDIDDNFFEIGGTSRLIAAVCVDLATRLGREVPLVAFYRHQNVRVLARYLAHGDADPAQPFEKGRPAVDGRRQRELRTAARAARRKVGQ